MRGRKVKILRKVRGAKRSRTVVHAYDEVTDSAMCRPWPKPSTQWEIQDVADFMAIPERERCLHCTDKLMPTPPMPPKPPSAREQRWLDDLAKLAAWNTGGQS